MEEIDVIAGERLAQAYLLVGEGAAEVARQLVRRILCNGDSTGCAKIERGVHPDAKWITKGKRAIGIDQIRKLQEDALYPPSEAPRKVYVIAEAEMLSLEAANSLLRILEDPPPYLIFILLARSLDLLPTIISRCRVVRLMPRAPAAIREELRSRGMGEEEIDYLLAVTKGLPHLLSQLPGDLRPLEERARILEQLKDMESRGLVKLLAKASNPIEAREVALELLQQIPRLSSYQILDLAAALSRLDRETLGGLLREAIFWFRDLLAVSIPGMGLFNLDREVLLRQIGEGYDSPRLLKLIPILERARSELEGNANLQLLLEASLLRMREVSG
jgi:DNA polymerase-3 subunit delta'